LAVFRNVTVFGLAALQLASADWNPQRAAAYLDSRQETWFAWRASQHASGGRCLSCHTGLPYLLARPALRRALGESKPTLHEIGLLDGVRTRLTKTTPQEFLPNRKESAHPLAAEQLGVESVLGALLLALEDRQRGVLSQDTERALERMWALQESSGETKGAWQWNSVDLDPWEQPESMFFGASLAALATGAAPSSYQSRPGIRSHLEALNAYLGKNESQQPLHNRLVQVWASIELPGVLSQPKRNTVLEDLLRRQEADGGWTLQSLGPWRKHQDAPAAQGSNAYATAFTTFVLQRAGVSRDDPRLSRALDWLRSHQDPKEGFWEAQSMNKRYDSNSIPVHFMRDAATAFASLSLVDAR
jgi:squalene-hopene/tetraprenyl-beta-curcumene cyclase